MDVVDLLAELGGVARGRALLRVVTRRDLEAAVDAGRVRRDARGRFSLPGVDESVCRAARLGGVLSLTSAAQHHGWGVAVVPDKPHVTVSRGRKLGSCSDVHVHFAELRREQIDGPATSAATTLEQCLRRLPFTEALCVADSALREGFGRAALSRIAQEARGPGARQVRRVAAAADRRAANPFESTLRGISLDVEGLAFTPQVWIRDGDAPMRPDLVDESLRLVAEADSFEWHGGRRALANDARRYNSLVIHGWSVLRFSYEDVMFQPQDVWRVLTAGVALTELLNNQCAGRRSAA